MKIYYGLSILILLLSSCYNDEGFVESEKENIEPPKIYINTQLEGKVYNSDNEGLEDYTLFINNRSYDFSDSTYSVDLRNVEKTGETIKVYKDGSLIGITTIPLIENDVNRHFIHTHQTINSYTLEPELTISNFYFNTENSSWLYHDASEVQLEFAKINMANINTEVGYTEHFTPLALDLKRGFYINFLEKNGNNISPDDNESYTLTIHDDEDEIGLFRYDETLKKWMYMTDIKNDERITLHYTGYFALAHYTDGILLENTVKVDGFILKTHKIEINQQSKFSRTKYLSQKGKIITYIPSESEVTATLYSNCNSELIGRYSINSGTERIQKTESDFSRNDAFQYLGLKLLTCKDDDFTRIEIRENDHNIPYFINDSTGDIAIPTCLTAHTEDFQLHDLKTGTNTSYSVKKLADYTLLICDENPNGYIFLSIDHENKLYKSLKINTEADKTVINSMKDEVSFILPEIKLGSYETTDINISIDDKEIGNSGYYISCKTSSFGCGITEFEVNEFNWKNQDYYIIKFQGESWIQTINPPKAKYRDISGTILIEK